MSDSTFHVTLPLTHDTRQGNLECRSHTLNSLAAILEVHLDDILISPQEPNTLFELPALTGTPSMAPKGKGENTKKAAGNAKKAEAAAQKQAVEDQKKSAAEAKEWSKGSKDTSKA